MARKQLGANISNIADATTKAYVDTGQSFKQSARVSTTSGETFTVVSGSVTQINGTTIDGVSIAVGDRVLIRDAPASSGLGSISSSQPGNGIYTVVTNTTNLIVQRANDMTTGSNSPAGAIVAIEAGTINGGLIYMVNTPNSAGAFTYGTGSMQWGYIIPNSLAITSSFATFQNKTLDNTNIITIKDGNFTLQDSVSATKQLRFDASAITPGQTRTFTLPDANDTIVTLGATQALSGKTIAAGSNTITGLGIAALGGITGTPSNTNYLRGDGIWATPPTGSGAAPRINSTTSSATPTIDITTTDQYNITALSQNITSLATTGTAVDGQKLIVRVKDNGSTRTITWSSSNFLSSGSAGLLTTTVAGKTHLSGFVYDSVVGKWICSAVDTVGY